MEIDKAIKESDDRRLKTKYNNAIYVIQRAFALYKMSGHFRVRMLGWDIRYVTHFSNLHFAKSHGLILAGCDRWMINCGRFEEVAFSFNGGKDSTVLLHLLRAGYFLHQGGHDYSSGIPTNCELKLPLRTIYFETPSAFPEINSFTYKTAENYGLQIEIIRLDFKSGLEALIKEKPTTAIFLGTRIGDPNAVGQEQFSPSSPGWPPFMRVNPILDWSYRDVWAFLRTCKAPYCTLYDQGYTSIGSIYDTVPNALLCVGDPCNKHYFKPAYQLPDGRLERAGRAKKYCPSASGNDPILSNGLASSHEKGTLTASVISVGDEILFGTVEDQVRPLLCKRLHSVGWALSYVAVVCSDIDSVAEEVERQKSANVMVFILGGVGPLHSDVSVAGVAKSFGVRLAPDEEFEEYLRHLIGNNCTGDRNEMAQLPEGITELLHHEELPVPLIKCHNVIILSATNVTELDKQWDCLAESTMSSSSLVLVAPFVSKQLTTTLADVKIAGVLSQLCLEFPDIRMGCYRKSREGPLIVSFVGKDQVRIELAVQALCQKFNPGTFSEINCG